MQRGLAYRLARQWDRAVVSLERGLASFDPDMLTSEWATWYVTSRSWRPRWPVTASPRQLPAARRPRYGSGWQPRALG